MRFLLSGWNSHGATRRREGSGSVHKQEFVQFLNIARRSLFEDASMLLVFERLELLKEAETDELLRYTES
jgi:four helix bundle protein